MSNSSGRHISRVGSDGQSKLSGQEVPLQEFRGLGVVHPGLLCHVQETARVRFQDNSWSYNNFLEPY